MIRAYSRVAEIRGAATAPPSGEAQAQAQAQAAAATLSSSFSPSIDGSALGSARLSWASRLLPVPDGPSSSPPFPPIDISALAPPSAGLSRSRAAERLGVRRTAASLLPETRTSRRGTEVRPGRLPRGRWPPPSGGARPGRAGAPNGRSPDGRRQR